MQIEERTSARSFCMRLGCDVGLQRKKTRAQDTIILRLQRKSIREIRKTNHILQDVNKHSILKAKTRTKNSNAGQHPSALEGWYSRPTEVLSCVFWLMFEHGQY